MCNGEEVAASHALQINFRYICMASQSIPNVLGVGIFGPSLFTGEEGDTDLFFGSPSHVTVNRIA